MSKRAVSILGALGVCLLLSATALPASARAKIATRIDVPTATVSIGTRACLGTGVLTCVGNGTTVGVPAQNVKIYRRDPAKRVWVYVAKRKTGSTGAFTMPLPGGESYRYVYSGSERFHSSLATVTVELLPGAPAPFVVTIDAGHQSIRTSATEPIGPGSHTRKPAVASGTRGRHTHTSEYVRNLQVSFKLRYALAMQGVKVVMVRTANHVNMANSHRAKVANDAHSDLFVRVHCDGSTSRFTHGISTLTPGRNTWTGPIVSRSLSASRLIQRGMIKYTRATDRGVAARKDMAGFNWSKVPAVIVEIGFMTNTAEDKRMATRGYQDELTRGMTEGVMRYLGSR